jgi:hypothetical protein
MVASGILLYFNFCDSFHKKFEKNLINSHSFVKPSEVLSSLSLMAATQILHNALPAGTSSTSSLPTV